MLFEYKEKSLKSGIYQIKNLINGKVYIGSAKEFKSRGRGHLNSLKKGKHHNKHLQAAFDKDGENNFIFEVLEVIEGNKLIRTTKEKEYLARYYVNWEECYNFQKNPLSTDRKCWSKAPEKTRKKQSANMKKRWKDPEYCKFQTEHQAEKSKILWQESDYRERHINAIRDFYNSDASLDVRRRASKRMSERHVSDLTKNKISKAVSVANRQLWQEPEYREKVILGRKISWENDIERKQRAAKRLEKTYILRTPAGEIITITNIHKFCKNNTEKLLPCQLSKVARGLIDTYKGWTRP